MAPSGFSRLVNRTKRALTPQSRSLAQAAGHPQDPDVVPGGQDPVVGHPQGLEIVADGQDPVVDIVALHGLNGHREKTWTADNGVHWLRDLLPQDLPHARILCWGYDANTHATDRVSWQYLYDHARALVSDLCRKRKMTDSVDRPIIFIAHSLGGIVLKSALIHSDAARQGALLEQRSIALSTYGILFMGTPHQGGNGVQFGRILANVASLVMAADDRLLKHLERDSEWLQQQLGQYAPISSNFVTKFAYEEYPTPTAMGHTLLVVPKASAVVPGHADAEPIVIHANHTSMVRYKSKQDNGYVTVSEHLQIMVKDATSSVQSRWAAEARANDARDNKNQESPQHPVRSWFIVPYLRNEGFVGRASVLQPLQSQLGFGVDDTEKPRQRVALHGLGGIGKTQIALAYVYWLQATCPEISVFWVHASNAERFLEGYSSIAEICDIPGRHDPKADVRQLVKTWLENTYRSRWLMVIDNADDTELFFHSTHQGDVSASAVEDNDRNLSRYLPQCAHGSILATSRNKQTAIRFTAGKPSIEVQKMTDDEAGQLVHTTMEDDTISRVSIAHLATRLEHLPLALAQAAAFMQENTITADDYIRLLDESDSALVDHLSEPFETVGRESGTPHAVTATWIISFEQIERQHASASSVLSMASLLDRQAIPKILICNYLRRQQSSNKEGSDLVELTKALGTLQAFSFISQGANDTVDMHRLIQLVTRKWLVTRRRVAMFAREALMVVSDAYPYGSFERRELCVQYLPHANAVLAHAEARTEDEQLAKANLLLNIGGFFLYLGRWREAESLFVQVMETTQRVLGEEHPDTLTSMANLASTYRNQGRWKEAESLEVQVMETTQRVLGEEHPDTLASMANLASTYRDQGRWKEAESLEVQVLETRQRVLGEEHPDTLTSMANLASTYWNQGRWEEAESLFVQVIETTQRVLGEEHPNTLTTMGNLASTYWDQGRWKEAESLEVQVMETRQRVLGEEHPDTLITMANLAFTWNEQGKSTEGIELLQRCYRFQVNVLGSSHPHTTSSAAALEKWQTYEKA